MYPWVETWNPVGGKCPHRCSYCYRNDMMRFPQNKRKYSGEPRFIDIPIPKTDKVIFVCSMNDLFASSIKEEIIKKVLRKCREKQDNTYLLQSKNPYRFNEFLDKLPEKVILGTTIETNRYVEFSLAPSQKIRLRDMVYLSDFDTMVSIEPIMDFDLDVMIGWMKAISPEFVSMGADSKSHNLPEPTPEKIKKLIKELEKFTEVRIKKNLSRVKT